MEKQTLLEQLYMVKYVHERRSEYAHMVSKCKMLESILKKKWLGFGVRKDLKYRLQTCNENMRNMNSRINELNERSKDARAVLNSDLIQDAQYVNTAIDDLIMGRASDENGLNSLYTMRRNCYREDYPAALARREI